MGVPILRYRDKLQSSLKDITSLLEEEKKVLWKCMFNSLFSPKYFWKVFSLCSDRRGYNIHPQSRASSFRDNGTSSPKVVFPLHFLSVVLQLVLRKKKRNKKNYLALSIKPLNIFCSFILSLVLSISLSLIKLWSIIKRPTAPSRFSEVWNTLPYVLLGNFELPSNLLS